jgi:hypothetical protein
MNLPKCPHFSKTYSGTANIDIRDSTPDWGPYEQPKSPDGAPNVIYLVLDDVGFGAMSVFGGLIETPNLERLADKVAEISEVRAQIGKFALTGEGLNVGRDGSAPVTDDYPGSMPWRFTGGDIARVSGRQRCPICRFRDGSRRNDEARVARSVVSVEPIEIGDIGRRRSQT